MIEDLSEIDSLRIRSLDVLCRSGSKALFDGLMRPVMVVRSTDAAPEKCCGRYPYVLSPPGDGIKFTSLALMFEIALHSRSRNRSYAFQEIAGGVCMIL